jgi:hypothetical protein
MKKSKDVLVNYNYMIGDVEVFGQVLIEMEGSETLEDAIHNYFMKFWGEDGIEKYEKCRRYYSFDRAIKIDDWRLVPEREAKILKRYLPVGKAENGY